MVVKVANAIINITQAAATADPGRFIKFSSQFLLLTKLTAAFRLTRLTDAEELN